MFLRFTKFWTLYFSVHFSVIKRQFFPVDSVKSQKFFKRRSDVQSGVKVVLYSVWSRDLWFHFPTCNLGNGARPGAGGPWTPLPFPWELKISEIIITVTRDGVSANISKILMLGFRYYVIASFLKMSQFSASMRYTRRNIAHLAQANAHYFLV